MSPASNAPPLDVKIVLADDHVMVREALGRILDEEPGIEVVAQAGNRVETLEAVERHAPDLLVLDYAMPGSDAPSLIEDLLSRHESLRIVVLTVHQNVHYALRVLESGAHGYLIKSDAAEELVEAIRAVNAGRVHVSSLISQEVFQRLRRPKGKRTGVEALSQREFACLVKLGQGLSLQQCADELHVSVSTVSTYRARIMQKLDLRSTADLIRFALENELGS